MGSVKITTLTPDNPDRGLPLIHGVVVLTDLETGRITALLDGGELTAGRTGAVADLATRLCAPEAPDWPSSAPVQPCALVRTVSAVRPIRSVRVFSRSRARTERFAEWVRAGHPVRHGVRHGEGHRRRRRGHLHGDLDQRPDAAGGGRRGGAPGARQRDRRDPRGRARGRPGAIWRPRSSSWRSGPQRWRTRARWWRNLDPRRNFDWMTPRENWQLIDDLGNVPNRLILARGSLPHSGAAGWGNALENGRFYQTFFFRTLAPRRRHALWVSL